MATYWEKLKDPRWQRKRLEILERDAWTCAGCLDTEATLHVHHGYYDRNRDPWDYENESLYTYCESCHEAIQEVLRETHREIGFINNFGLLRNIRDALSAIRSHGDRSKQDRFKAVAFVIWKLSIFFRESDWKQPYQAAASQWSALDLDSDIAIGAGCGV